MAPDHAPASTTAAEAAPAPHPAPAYALEYVPPDKESRFTPKGRKFNFQLGEHKLTVQTGAVCDRVRPASEFLRACLHTQSEQRGLIFLGVVTSCRVRKDQATIGDLQALVSSVQFKACGDCDGHFLLDPQAPYRHLCKSCLQLRKSRLAGDILLSQQSHLARRMAQIEKATVDGMTHVVVRKKNMTLNLQRFVRVPRVLRSQLCTLEVYRFFEEAPRFDDFIVPFTNYEGLLHEPEEALVFTLEEFHEQTVQRQELAQRLTSSTARLREAVGDVLLREMAYHQGLARKSRVREQKRTRSHAA
ncbi:MAG: hypothetical protein U1E02_14820 [Hydrogenophaga sp.]|nr:hypothetical protein [Hydrogenophaga sp.]